MEKYKVAYDPNAFFLFWDVITVVEVMSDPSYGNGGAEFDTRVRVVKSFTNSGSAMNYARYMNERSKIIQDLKAQGYIHESNK